MKKSSSSLVAVAVIGRPHGVRGLFKVKLLIEDISFFKKGVLLRQKNGKRWKLHLLSNGIAKLEDELGNFLCTREDAAILTNEQLFADRSDFPELDEDEFYHSDLEGLKAFNSEGDSLGTVERVHDYGAGVSLELSSGDLIPFNKKCVPHVDLKEKKIVLNLPSYIEAKGPDKGQEDDLENE